jgi:hypothetical protein
LQILFRLKAFGLKAILDEKSFWHADCNRKASVCSFYVKPGDQRGSPGNKTGCLAAFVIAEPGNALKKGVIVQDAGQHA